MARTYELRTYVTESGRMDLLLDRFRNHTVRLFARHGMESIGYWLSDQDDDTLLYLLAHEDRDSAAESWKAFRADVEWQTVKARSEEHGPIVRSVTSVLLEPTDFSPLR